MTNLHDAVYYNRDMGKPTGGRGVSGTLGAQCRRSGGVARLRNESGQVAILFALVFTFMFVLFAFVVDFGHLINNKINLQIAADAAAYAGAAQQARVMNRLSMVNYRLRQNFKEFAMRTQVTHTRHNFNFPRGLGFINGGNASPAQTGTDMFVCQQAHGYVSISGRRYAQNTNLCRNASPTVGGLPPIVVPPVIADFDPFAIAIQAQIRQVQQAANQECRGAAIDNRVLAQYMASAYASRSQFYMQQAQGLVDYINEVEQENNASSSRHHIVRTAYASALRNLTLGNNNDEFQMEVLKPRGGQYLQVNPYNVRGSLIFMNFQVRGNGCIGIPDLLDFNDMVGGFAKNPGLVTWFGVKLTAKPRLFFMPNEWVENNFPTLTAVATAKPFGSRLGPEVGTDFLMPIANRPGNTSRILNFSTRPRDALGVLNTKLMAFYDALHPFNGIGRPNGDQTQGWPLPRPRGPADGAMIAVRAPTMFDATFYSVFPDVGGNANTDYLEPQFARALYPDYLENFDEGGNNTVVTPPRSPPYFRGLGTAGGFIRALAANRDGFGPYAGYLQEGASAHSVTSAQHPALQQIISSDQRANEFGFATPEQIHSGWAPDGDPGRIGYSVKFIGMDALTRTLRVRLNSAGSEGPIANPPIGDTDFSEIFH